MQHEDRHVPYRLRPEEIEGGSSLPFLFLCAYMLSQAFMIPVLAIGPSWAVWPRLSDFAFFGMAGSILLSPGLREEISYESRVLCKTLTCVLGLALFSFFLNLLFVGEGTSLFDGVYDLSRLVQFLAIFWITTRIPLTRGRFRTLGWVADITFLLASLSIFLTYFSIVPLGVLTAHLPQDPGIAGNWSDYAMLDSAVNVTKGLGTISYSHAYGAVQILMLLALRMLLARDGSSLVNAVFLLVGLAALVLTESRAGLAAGCLFAFVLALRNPKLLLLGCVLGGLALVSLNVDKIGGTLERQQTIVSALEGDNLSGRPEIWKRHLRSLNENPYRWVIGGGVGTARVSGYGSNAHMLPLQIVVETGIIGLMIFGVIMISILAFLFSREPAGSKPIFWVTIALLLSAVSQETFYPVPSMGHFLGLYLVAVALVFETSDNEGESEMAGVSGRGQIMTENFGV